MSIVTRASAPAPLYVEEEPDSHHRSLHSRAGLNLRGDAPHAEAVSPAAQFSRMADAAPIARRQRFYPAQWRRAAQPTIDALLDAHGQPLQWIGWDRSLPRLYLSAEQLTRAVVDLLRVTVRNTDHSRGQDRVMCLRVGWQSGATQALVLVLEHAQLELSKALIAALNESPPQPRRSSQRLSAEFHRATHDELMRVRGALQALGGSMIVSRGKATGTLFRLSLPVDDRATLVRGWLQQATADAMQIRLYVVGRRQPEALAALNASDARMHALASSGEMIYRAARSRWLWLTPAGQLPAALLGDAWQTQLVGRWSCPPAAASYGDCNRTATNQFASNQFASNQFASNQFASNQFASNQFASNQFAAETVAQDSATRLSVARAIASRMESVLGRRVPPIDDLELAPTRSRRLRVDRAAELNSAHNLVRRMQAAAAGPGNAKPPAPALARQRRWRYPI